MASFSLAYIILSSFPKISRGTAEDSKRKIAAAARARGGRRSRRRGSEKKAVRVCRHARPASLVPSRSCRPSSSSYYQPPAVRARAPRALYRVVQAGIRPRARERRRSRPGDSTWERRELGVRPDYVVLTYLWHPDARRERRHSSARRFTSRMDNRRPRLSRASRLLTSSSSSFFHSREGGE